METKFLLNHQFLLQAYSAPLSDRIDFTDPHGATSAKNREVACTAPDLSFEKCTNIIPEKSSVKTIAYFDPSRELGKIGPAKSL